MSDETRSLADVLRLGAEHLERSGVEEGRLAVELLLARLVRIPRLELALHGNDTLAGPRLEALRRGVRRVAAGEPVQYVLGETEFRGHRIRVDRRALIPRPETEGLVELVLARAEVWRDATPSVLDYGTGSGCIALALALERPAARVVAFDSSAEALALARENFALHGVEDRIQLHVGELADCEDLEPETLDAVVSNPPYVTTADWEALPRHIREHEPRMALDGGADGLDVVRGVAIDAAAVLRPGGGLFLEIGVGQGATVAAWLVESGFAAAAVHPDLAGRERYVVARMPE